jgi:transposase-like protein
MDEFDHEFTDEIVCPYCGYEHGDSWEEHDDRGDLECQGCGKKFCYERNISVDYSTYKIKPRKKVKPCR